MINVYKYSNTLYYQKNKHIMQNITFRNYEIKEKK